MPIIPEIPNTESLWEEPDVDLRSKFSGKSESIRSYGKKGGSIELQQIGDSGFEGTVAETAQMMFDKYYVRGEGFDPIEWIKLEYGGEMYAAQLQPGKMGLGTNKYFLDLQNQLADLFMLDDIFSGDAASEVIIQGTDDQLSGSLGDAGRRRAYLAGRRQWGRRLH